MLRVVLADPVGSRLAHLVEPSHPDHGTPYQVEGIGESVVPRMCDLGVIDLAERVTDEESFAVARRLIREEGLFVGGSSGTTVAAATTVPSSPFWPTHGTDTCPCHGSGPVDETCFGVSDRKEPVASSRKLILIHFSSFFIQSGSRPDSTSESSHE